MGILIRINQEHGLDITDIWGPLQCENVLAERSLIIGTGCGVQVFSLILDSSVGLSAGT